MAAERQQQAVRIDLFFLALQPELEPARRHEKQLFASSLCQASSVNGSRSGARSKTRSRALCALEPASGHTWPGWSTCRRRPLGLSVRVGRTHLVGCSNLTDLALLGPARLGSARLQIKYSRSPGGWTRAIAQAKARYDWLVVLIADCSARCHLL